MKSLITVLIAGVLFVSCSGKKDSASSIAQKWCDLNAKVTAAETDEARAAAESERKKYETQMQEKYKDNEAFMTEVGAEIEKCEDASEGR